MRGRRESRSLFNYVILMKRMGEYELVRLLGQGGMAEVWLARRSGPLGTHKNVVLKRVLEHQADNRKFREAFIDEARLVVRLNHPHIVSVLEIIADERRPALVLELVDGIDLERLQSAVAAAGGLLPVEVAVRIVADLLRALDYAHHLTDEAGQPLHIVHRDVSPPNVLLGCNGEVKLADFGIAKARGRLTKTAFGLLKGKASYMSPEQAGGKPLDHRSDLFSVGVVFWECLTGRPLFACGDDLATLNRVREIEAESPHLLRRDVDENLAAIVMRLLAKDPTARYPQAREALTALENNEAFRRGSVRAVADLVNEFAGESPTSVPRTTDLLDLAQADSADDEIATPPARRWRKAMAAVVALFAVGLLGLWWTYRPPPPRSAPPLTTLRDATLIVQPATHGAVAYWDETPLGSAPLVRDYPLDRRRHEVRLHRPGYVSLRYNFAFDKPRRIDAAQHLVRQNGTVFVSSPTADTWSIAGRTVAAGEEALLPTGAYLAQNERGETRLITVRANQKSML